MGPRLYRGVWPANVSRLAKYAVRFVDGEWQVTVLYDLGEGLTYLAVEGKRGELVQQVNDVKVALAGQPGGAFYVNEYRHVIVPVAGDGAGPNAHYYYAGRLLDDLRFDFEGRRLETRAVSADGRPLSPGERWVGPRPGIPYVLAAGAGDIYYEMPALTDSEPPEVRPNTTRRVQLTKVVAPSPSVQRNIKSVAALRGHQGGRFYVNEHGAMFTPTSAGDGNGIEYVYAGQLERAGWFAEPQVDVVF
ncbi:MAG: hypothetical protein AB7H88_11760 [Vicinamibacterales bacterium]